jgi:drug/metabolite transporter (DMT)-like permease
MFLLLVMWCDARIFIIQVSPIYELASKWKIEANPPSSVIHTTIINPESGISVPPYLVNSRAYGVLLCLVTSFLPGSYTLLRNLYSDQLLHLHSRQVCRPSPSPGVWPATPPLISVLSNPSRSLLLPTSVAPHSSSDVSCLSRNVGKWKWRAGMMCCVLFDDELG